MWYYDSQIISRPKTMVISNITYPKGIFRPRVAYGLNFYIPRFQTVSLDLGANIKVSEKLFISLTSEFEFNSSLLVVPQSKFSQSFKVGLFTHIK